MDVKQYGVPSPRRSLRRSVVGYEVDMVLGTMIVYKYTQCAKDQLVLVFDDASNWI